jgi:Fe-Mn family superoxide dismutase
VCDLWEHAYYLDWEEDRAGFIRAVVERLINWQHVAARLKRRLEAHAA